MEAPETSLVESVRSTEPGYREMATAVSGLDLHRPDQPHTHGARGGQQQTLASQAHTLR